MTDIAPGRKHDMEVLEARLRTAKSVREKENIKSKMAYILREGKDQEISKLRGYLVNAARAGDNKAGDEISEEIYKRQGRLGK